MSFPRAGVRPMKGLHTKILAPDVVLDVTFNYM